MPRAMWALVLIGCAGGGDDGTPTDGAGSCEAGCAETVVAACPEGPATEAQCVADCEALLQGPCAAEYEDVLACSEGEPVTCDAGGYPTVAACSAEFATFGACLNP